VKSNGVGSTLHVTGAGARLLGFTVDGSGGRFDTLDAAVKVHKAKDVVIEGIAVRGAVFGILVELAESITVRGNHVRGTDAGALGLRGDSIRLWETHRSRVEDNVVDHGRDVVVWYSSDNVVRGNVVRGGRYGTHLMYSHRNDVAGNRFEDNVVGVFLMYSRDVTVRDNVLAGSSGAAGMGLGLKESGNVTTEDNRFVGNTVGVYLDNSPLQQDDHNAFRRNSFRLGDAGVVFHSSGERNTFETNSFRDNHVPVRVEGGGDALGVAWNGNDFDDYAGYDLDGDRVGDVPYELRSLAADLVSRHPDLEFFRGSTTLSLVNVASEVVPLLAPKILLRDSRPRMGSLEMSDAN
jgi:nitrous oxidase accessory protein